MDPRFPPIDNTEPDPTPGDYPDELIDESDPRLARRGQPYAMTENGHPMDDKGRVDVRFMSVEEKLNEIVMSMRQTQDMVSAFIGSMETNPMMKGIARMIGGGR